MRTGRRAASCILAAGLAACATAPVPQPYQPEASTGVTPKAGATAQRRMIAAAHPLAAEAGLRVLREGGNAMDAAVAVQMVLALVEPQSSGIGGGAFLLHWDGREVAAWDGRETAPAAADEKLFLHPDGKPMPFMQAVAGGRAVGVPGAVRMLEAAHRLHGRLPWARLFAPAIEIAERGFPVGPRLHALLRSDPALHADKQAREYFYAADGAPHPVGHRLRNPALAHVLHAIAARGSAVLHVGPVAADIVRRVRAHASNPGLVTAADLERYAPKRREALCTDWTAAYRVCGFPPPSSGQLAVMQILGTLDTLGHAAAGSAPARQQGVPGADWLHVYTEAARLAYADRAMYVADPDFVAAPAGRWTSLLDPAYLAQRAALIGPTSMKAAAPGVPPGTQQGWAPQADEAEAGTSHVSIVDDEGRAVALTTTIEAAFGARLMSDGGSGLAGGFLLNNQLTDFSFAPADPQGRPIANRVQPGKRPRSSMAPMLVFDRASGALVMTLGSPGGATIPHYVAKTLLGTLAWGLPVQQAIDLPNFGSLNGPTLLEAGRFPAATVEALRARGHEVREVDLTSGVHAVHRTGARLQGGADPRREGVAAGD
jgi:gamma-glutamyltranspeptidase/glutathione hydrolase